MVLDALVNRPNTIAQRQRLYQADARPVYQRLPRSRLYMGASCARCEGAQEKEKGGGGMCGSERKVERKRRRRACCLSILELETLGRRARQRQRALVTEAQFARQGFSQDLESCPSSFGLLLLRRCVGIIRAPPSRALLPSKGRLRLHGLF
jgi:hypothetical protein